MLALLLASAWTVALAPASPPSPVLVAYDFDGEDVETGPYTLIAYEHARGSVSLSSTFRHSGTRAVEIRDVAGDGEFAELQGFFRELPSGRVFAHFAFMLAEAGEPMNIALAGQGHFAPRKDGFGFWLKAEGGWLRQVTGGKDVPLFPLQAFVWYVCDVAYDVDRGRYDLTVRAEGQAEPLVALQDLPNPMGLQGSRIHKFSFIGDPPGRDRSNARFYVDDIVISTDQPVAADGPFVAPGRRLLFVDIERHYRSLLDARPGCLPALGPEDFGLGPSELQSLAAQGGLRLYDALADGRAGPLPAELPSEQRAPLEAMAAWGRGCAPGCTPACALHHFEAAHAQVPQAKLYALSRVLALAGASRWREADALLFEQYHEWRGDPRFPLALALLGLARGRPDEAEQALARAAEREDGAHPALARLWAGERGQALLRELQAAFPADWGEHVETALVAEQRYYVLLWQERYDAAQAYAERLAARLRGQALSPAAWLERRGDAQFWLGDTLGALQSYQESLALAPARAHALYGKLSDAYFRLGDLERERQYREKVYGSLRR